MEHDKASRRATVLARTATEARVRRAGPQPPVSSLSRPSTSGESFDTQVPSRSTARRLIEL